MDSLDNNNDKVSPQEKHLSSSMRIARIHKDTDPGIKHTDCNLVVFATISRQQPVYLHIFAYLVDLSRFFFKNL